jgi:hypothetical protein
MRHAGTYSGPTFPDAGPTTRAPWSVCSRRKRMARTPTP